MIKTLRNLLKQDKERFVVPRGVQDVIPIKAIYDDGIFQVGRDKFSKTYKFSDINYAVASREDKEAMFLEYSELLNSLDSGATTKITMLCLIGKVIGIQITQRPIYLCKFIGINRLHLHLNGFDMMQDNMRNS